jgi:diguanylate cyclase (GGDEF)-like protein
MNAHIPTLFLTIILVGSVLTLSVGVVAKRSDRDGMRYCASGLAMHTLAFVLFSQRGQISDILSIVIANTLLSAALASFTEGICEFHSRALKRSLIWSPVALVLVAFIMLRDNFGMRVMVSAAIFAMQCLLAWSLLWSRRRQTIGNGKYFLLGGLAISAITLIVRAIDVATRRTAMLGSLTDSNSIQTLTFMGSLTSLVLLSIGFVLMSKERADDLNRTLATQDELTNLANRRALNLSLTNEWARSVRTGQPLAVALVDVDHFKSYNDCYGHQSGDECLRSVANAIKASVRRAGDLAARYGGEEFVIVLPHSDAAASVLLAESVRATVEALCLPHAQSPLGRVTISIGIAVLEHASHPDIDHLLRAADRALYQAKEGGRNQVREACAPDKP